MGKTNQIKIKKTNRPSAAINHETLPEWLVLLPAIVVIAIIPLLIRLAVIDTPAANMVWPTQASVGLTDLFSYRKGTLLMICAIFMFLLSIIRRMQMKQSLQGQRWIWLVFAYLAFVMLATVFSINKELSLTGFSEHYENTCILLAYMAVFLYAASLILNEKMLRGLIHAWIPAILFMFVLGISQYTGHDLVLSDIGEALVVPSQYEIKAFSQDTDNLRNVYQTLFHYNYVSFYASIGLPFFLVLAIYEQKRLRRFLYGFIALVFMINQVLSLSRNGYLGIAAALFAVLVFTHGKWKRYWKIALPGLLILSCGAVLFASMSGTATAVRIREGFSSLFVPQNYALNEIITGDQEVWIDHDNWKMKIQYAPDEAEQDQQNDNTTDGVEVEHIHGYRLFDEKGNLLRLRLIASDGNTADRYVVLNEAQEQPVLQFDDSVDNPWIVVTFDEHDWIFHYSDAGMVVVMGQNRAETMHKVDSIGFEGYERFASARGYIWSRTLPIILKNGLFGTGPDTFALAFPQNDYVGKLQAYEMTSIIVDKPHNILLDYAISSGIPSLLMLLLLWSIYLYQSFRLYFNSGGTDFFRAVGIACSTAVIGYLFSGLFNDTNLNVTPTFWLLLGIGFAVNRTVSEMTAKKSRNT